MSTPISIAIAFAGGILPAMIWLFFWLKQDEKHPEPNKLILLSFFLGMFAIPFAFVIQTQITKLLIGSEGISAVFFRHYFLAITIIVILAAIEEVLKYIAAYFGGLSNKENDEPIDPVVYMITAALGFSALETTLFLLTPILGGEISTAIIAGNLRFVGASLVHVVSSGIIGIFMSFSFYKSQYHKQRYLLAGFIIAITLHAVFNSFIIRGGKFTTIGYIIIWVAAVIMISVFERIRLKVKQN